ncbi:MAG: glycoside hydrolase family 127 protein, partial [Clostridia bacterium]
AELRGEKRKNAEQDNMWSTYHYYQAHLPLKEQTTAEGHAVRAMYLFSGAADVARETGDEELFEALKKLWDNVTKRRMYITAAIGSQSYGEAFSLDYDLPNDTIYGETCASIGLAFFAHRMLQMDPDRKYADVLERAIYNGILSGISLDGKKFFYVNPLEVVPEVCEKRHDHFHVKVERQAWFACACCPANVSRLYTSIGDYIYSTSNDGEIYIHLFANSSANIALGDRNVVLDVNTRYPWDGNINIKVNPDLKGEFTIAVRVPSWCHEPSIRVNGQPVNIEEHMDKGYVKIKRVWEPGDAIDVVYPMKAMLVRTNPRVRENAGKVAIQRGPMVYCIEEVDNGKNLHNIIVPKDVEFKETFEEGLLNGVVAIIFKAYRLKDWPCDECYSFDQNSYEEIEVKAIPYYAWGNRGVGEMTVWMREEMCI